MVKSRHTREAIVECDLFHDLLIRWSSERVGPVGLKQVVRYAVECIIMQT